MCRATFVPSCPAAGYAHADMSTVATLQSAMEAIAPTRHAAEWDNTGLLIGRRDAAFQSALLCIDLTPAVAAQARQSGVQAVVAYHPVIFESRTSINDADPCGAMLLDLIEAGIAVYTPHSALDATPGGMADWLAAGIGQGSTSPIEPSTEMRPGEAVKIVTYVPRDVVEAVRNAMGRAGAGRIGDYAHCSTAIENIGTFIGSDTSTPATGTAGSLETVEECRLMMVCGESHLADSLHALRTAHPYEEPPVHVIPLRAAPQHDSGIGRTITLDAPASLDDIVSRLKGHLGMDTLRVAEGIGGQDAHRIGGCCPGAGGTLLDAAERAGATIYVTGEMRHHDVLAAVQRGTTIILAGHTNTERAFLPTLAVRLATAMPECTFSVSSADVCPWTSR